MTHFSEKEHNATQKSSMMYSESWLIWDYRIFIMQNRRMFIWSGAPQWHSPRDNCWFDLQYFEIAEKLFPILA